MLLAAMAIAVVVILLWRADVACHVPRHRDALKIGNAAGCIEFWLNRYQSAWAGMLGATAALFAAWIAWQAVQRQIDVQATANKLNELTYWQKKADDSELGCNGIDIISSVTASVVRAIANAEIDDDEMHPYVDKLRAVQATGMLDVAHFPATGPDMSAWKLNIQITALRTLYHALQRDKFMGTDEGQEEFQGVSAAIKEIHHDLPTLRSLRAADLARAKQALASLSG